MVLETERLLLRPWVEGGTLHPYLNTPHLIFRYP